MINANKELLNSFYSNNLQYVVPFFQRAYVWNNDNWDILWEHINRIADKTLNNSKNEHFIGTLITKQRLSNAIGENKLDLIDGQQRLTTFSLLIKAIATKASGQDPYSKLKEKTNELVVFKAMPRGRSQLRKLNGTPGRSSVYRKNSIRYNIIIL